MTTTALHPDHTPTGTHTVLEEVANAITHGIGAVLAAVGLGVLLVLAATRGGAGEIAALAIYGSSMVVLYLASTLYHSARGAALKRFFHKLDHAAIYLLIAGTYTPFTLLVLGGGWGWGLFVAVWALAIFGVTFKFAACPTRFPKLSVGLYLVMGWLGIVAIGPIVATLDLPGVLLLIGGGLAYTLGVPFYLWHKLPYNHAVWHLFCIAGSALHFTAIALYSLPPATVGA